jgi:hypothetical protein
VRPSPPLLRHTAHCYNCSNTIKHAGTGHRHACHCTSYGPLSTAPSSPLAGGDRTVNHYASTLEVAPVRAQDAPRRRDWSEIRQDGRQLHGTARHIATRREIVRHAYKSPSPWPIKGRRSPSRRGIGQQTVNTHTLSAFPTILALASISTPGTWRPRLLSHLACSHPSTSTSVQRNTVSRAHHCWTYGPSRNQDKPSVISC